MKHKPRISTVVFILLLLIGLGVLLYPTICDQYTRWQLKKEIGQYNQVPEAQKEDYTPLWEAAEAYNQELATRSNQFSVSEEDRDLVATLLNPLGNGMMGYISIPKIDVNLPIYQGREEKALQSGAGWWVATSLPTGGESTHCVITAHTGLVKAKMFTDVDQLEIGDMLTLSILDRVLTYEVDQVQITEPDNFEPLLIEKGQDYVTLYTCYPYGVNTQRLLVRGHRIETPSTANTETMARWKIALIALSVLLFIVILSVIVIKKRKHKKKMF